MAYPSYEELTVLAAAGAVTERIGLMSNILLAPTRSTAELAKQAATVHELTGGRLTLGVATGGRADDYALTGRDFAARGRRFDEQLADLRRAFAGEPLADGSAPVVPDGAQPVPIMIGGTSDAAVRRTVEFGIGWTAGGVPPQMVAPFVERVRAAWRDAGREGSPRIVALNYFGLGDTEDRSRGYLLDYYGFLGPELAEMIAGGAHRSARGGQGRRRRVRRGRRRRADPRSDGGRPGAGGSAGRGRAALRPSRQSQVRRCFFSWPRCFFASIRRSCEPRVGLVRRRLGGGRRERGAEDGGQPLAGGLPVAQLLAVLAGGDGQDAVDQAGAEPVGQPLPLGAR